MLQGKQHISPALGKPNATTKVHDKRRGREKLTNTNVCDRDLQFKNTNKWEETNLCSQV